MMDEGLLMIWKRGRLRRRCAKQSQSAGGTADRCSASAVKQTQFRGFWRENGVVLEDKADLWPWLRQTKPIRHRVDGGHGPGDEAAKWQTRLEAAGYQ